MKDDFNCEQKEKIPISTISGLPQIYYCKKCERFTDVHYIADKKKGDGKKKSQVGGRPKSYCYKCGDEMLIPVLNLHTKELTTLKERLEKIDNRIYNINAYISANYVTGIKKPDIELIEKLNSYLAQIIGEIRDIHERI